LGLKSTLLAGVLSVQGVDQRDTELSKVLLWSIRDITQFVQVFLLESQLELAILSPGRDVLHLVQERDHLFNVHINQGIRVEAHVACAASLALSEELETDFWEQNEDTLSVFFNQILPS